MTLTVAHYLRIYTIRQAMARDGTTAPNETGRKLFDTLVAALSECDPASPCVVERIAEAGGEWIRLVAEGRVLAQLWMSDDDGEIALRDVR